MSGCDKDAQKSKNENSEWYKITYNPYKHRDFVLADDESKAVRSAIIATIIEGEGVWVFKPTLEKFKVFLDKPPSKSCPSQSYSQPVSKWVRFYWFILVFFLNLWFNILKMNEEQTFQFGPFEVTVFPATNEEDEWVEVEDCE